MPSRKQLILAGAAVGATALVVIAWRKYNRLPRELDVDDGADPAPATATAAGETAAPELGTAEREAEAQRAKERGNKRFQGKQYDHAIRDYTTAIELVAGDKANKNVAVYYGNRAQCYFSMDKFEEAIADCDASLQVDPKYIKALIRRAAACEKLGRLDQALVDFTAAGVLSRMSNELAVRGCERVVKEVASKKAAERLSQPIRGLPSTHFISMFVSSFKALRERVGGAHRSATDLDAAVKAAPSEAARGALLSERALARMSAGQFDEAMDDWLEAVAALPEEGAPSAATALSEWAATTSAGAEPALALTMCGMFKHLQGRHDEAMGWYTRALAARPGLVEALVMRASLWYEKQQLPQAHEDFATASAASPKHPDVFCHRGQLRLLQNEFSQAVSDLREAVRLDPGSVLAHVHLGMALHRNQQQSEALAAFAAAEKAFPDSPDVLNYSGELLMELNMLDAAKDKVSRAVSAGKGTFALGYVNQAVIKMTTGDMEGAMAVLAKAVAVDPLCETAHVHMAHLHIQAKELEKAVASYDTAIALLRVPQELTECYAMREAVAAQLSLLEAQRDLYEPILEELRQMQAQM